MESERLAIARWEIDAAVDELRSPAANAGAGIPRKALGNLHFAAFHLVQALLASCGISAHPRNDMQVALSLHFVKPGTLPKDSAKLLAELQAVRERADYQVDLAYDARDVRRHLDVATPLIEELTKVAGATTGPVTRNLELAWQGARASVRGRARRAKHK